MKKIFRFVPFVLLFASFGMPFLASAAAAANCPPGYISIDCPNGGTVPQGGAGGINISAITPYSLGIIYVINFIFVPVLMAIALIVFLWGVYKYFILGATEEKSRTDGRQFVLWGVIGFVVILSVWGLVAVVGNTLGLSPGGGAPPTPTL